MSADDVDISVVSSVQAIIALYRDAGSLFDRVKAGCLQRRDPPPSRVLEESVDSAPEEIEREKKRGISRYGAPFEAGDDEAIHELQEIKRELHSGLLEKLKDAADSDKNVDCTPLVEAADLGRDRTVDTLLELKKRLLQLVPSNESFTSDARFHQQVSPLSASPQFLQLTRQDTDKGETSNEPSSGSNSKRSSLLGLFKPNRNRSDSGQQSPSVSSSRSSRQLAHISSPSLLSLSKSSTRRDRQNSDITEESEGNSLESWDAEDNQPSKSHPALPSLGNSSPRTKQFVRSPSPTTNPTISSTLSGAPLGAPPIGSVQPNPENDYLGFCKGAARLQTGDRQAMQRTKEFNDGWSSSSVYYLACSSSKCAFAGHMDLDVIWNKVWAVPDKGIQFRWTFLAKSHIPQNKAKNHEYAYQCMFCVFLGLLAPVLYGTEQYLDHVNREHRGQVLGEVVLHRTWCIDNRVCDDGEHFDINLFPLTPGEHLQRREQSEALTEELLANSSKKSSDAQDSVIASEPEPWCEDLSDFHRTLTFEGRSLRQDSLRSFRSLGQS